MFFNYNKLTIIKREGKTVNKFIRCVWYLAITSVVGFVMGRIIPKKWFTWESFPWHPLKFEKDGTLYAKLKVKKWQSKVPDMSKLFKNLMPPKAIKKLPAANDLKVMLRETCVAEFVHCWLCLASLHCIRIMGGIGGIIVSLLYILGNIPFIIIQRYNRPRLNKLLLKYEHCASNTAQSLIPADRQTQTKPI